MDEYEEEELDEIESLIGGFAEDDDMYEAVKRTSYRPPKTAPGRIPPRRPSAGSMGNCRNCVTHAEHQASLASMARQLKTNSEAIKQLSNRMVAIARKEEAQISAVQNQNTNAIQMLLFLPLLRKNKSITTTQDIMGVESPGKPSAVQIREGTKVAIESDDLLTDILLFSTLAGGTQGGPGMFGSGNQNNLLPLALILSLKDK